MSNMIVCMRCRKGKQSLWIRYCILNSRVASPRPKVRAIDSSYPHITRVFKHYDELNNSIRVWPNLN